VAEGLSWSATAPWAPPQGHNMRRYLPTEARKRKGRERLIAEVAVVNEVWFRVLVRGELFHDVATFRMAYWRALSAPEREEWVRRDMATMVANIDGGIGTMQRVAASASSMSSEPLSQPASPLLSTPSTVAQSGSSPASRDDT
jgi:hypothetical protein